MMSKKTFNEDGDSKDYPSNGQCSCNMCQMFVAVVSVWKAYGYTKAKDHPDYEGDEDWNTQMGAADTLGTWLEAIDAPLEKIAETFAMAMSTAGLESEEAKEVADMLFKVVPDWISSDDNPEELL
jgi:hypothetical protein